MSNPPVPSEVGPSARRPVLNRRARRAAQRATRRAAAAAIVACGICASPAGAAKLESRSAANFRDAAGVQLHTSFVGFPGDRTSIQTLRLMLSDLGIWHVRDSVCLDTEVACVRPRVRLSQLAEALGPGEPKVDLLLNFTREVETHPDRDVRDADIERALTAMTRRPLAGMVAGMEQTNEPDLQKTANWGQITIGDNATTRRLLNTRQFASLSATPLLTPALGHPEYTQQLLAAGWPSSQSAVPNFHPYPPAWGGPENALSAPCQRNVTVLECVSRLAPAAAPVATETGYSTTGGAASANWVSERAQAVYLPRLLLDNFDKGVARSYLYELVDLGPDRSSATNGFGLYKSYLTSNGIVAGGPKPAATAISRLNERIGDAGAQSVPGALDVDLRGPAGEELGETDVRRVLLRRSDGSYVLALWQPKSVWSNVPNKQRTIEVPDLSVTVGVTSGGPSYWNATAFRPTLDDDGREYRGTERFTTAVGPDVTLIDLRPANDWQMVPGARYDVAPG